MTNCVTFTNARVKVASYSVRRWVYFFKFASHSEAIISKSWNVAVIELSRENNYHVFLFFLLIIRNDLLLFPSRAYVPPGILILFGNSTYPSYSRESSRPSPFHRISRFNSTEIQLLRLPGNPDFRKHFHRNLSPPTMIVQISRLRRLISSPSPPPYFLFAILPSSFPFR